MEKRIKVVWVLSLVSALVLIGVQSYWLHSQFRYVTGVYTQQIAHEVLQAGEEEYNLRKEESGGSFYYTINRNFAYTDSGSKESVKQKTMMMFTSGEQPYLQEKQQMLDSLMHELQDKPLRKMIAQIDMGDRPAGDTTSLDLTFDTSLPEDSIVIGMNRALVNWRNPFREELLDSVLRARIPGLSFSFAHVEPMDSVFMASTHCESKSLFTPAVEVCYAYSPFQRMGIRIRADIPVQPLFRQMAGQLFLAFGLILLLIGCLIFQIKTILKQRKLAELRQHFVNTMIHELRRPVQTLKAFVAFLGDKDMRSDETLTGQIVQDSMFELDNLSAYLNKLKDMVRADDEMTPLHLQCFDLEELVGRVIRLTHIPAGKTVDFTTRFEMESPRIEADPVHVANVLSNLIENAIKYSAPTVHIDIAVSRKAHELWLKVSDNGIGIPVVEQEKVFAKFYRGSNMPDRAIPGLGLGLSYVRLISEAHQGYVSLQSNPGEGTCVTLFLPQ